MIINMTIIQMEYMSNILIFAAIAFAASAIVMFFVLDIKNIWKISNRKYISVPKRHIEHTNDNPMQCIKQKEHTYSAGEGQTVQLSMNGSETTQLLSNNMSDPDSTCKGTTVLSESGINVIQDIMYVKEYESLEVENL